MSETTPTDSAPEGTTPASREQTVGGAPPSGQKPGAPAPIDFSSLPDDSIVNLRVNDRDTPKTAKEIRDSAQQFFAGENTFEKYRQTRDADRDRIEVGELAEKVFRGQDPDNVALKTLISRMDTDASPEDIEDALDLIENIRDGHIASSGAPAATPTGDPANTAPPRKVGIQDLDPELARRIAATNDVAIKNYVEQQTANVTAEVQAALDTDSILSTLMREKNAGSNLLIQTAKRVVSDQMLGPDYRGVQFHRGMLSRAVEAARQTAEASGMMGQVKARRAQADSDLLAGMGLGPSSGSIAALPEGVSIGDDPGKFDSSDPEFSSKIAAKIAHHMRHSPSRAEAMGR